METFIYSELMSEKICDKLLDFFEKNADRKIPDKIIGKKSIEIILTEQDEIFKEYDHHLDKVLKNYLKKYKHADNVVKFKISPTIKIQHYRPGEGFNVFHFENVGCEQSIRRHLVFMNYLNTVEDAGTEFLYQNYKTEAVKGKTTIWPSQWTHTHRGVINNKKEKIIITGWFNFYE